MNTIAGRVPLLLALALSLGACVPKPHVAHLRPAVTGIVVEEGRPVPGLGLYLAKFPGTNEPCTEMGERIEVAPDGRFAWAAIRERKLMDSVLNPVALRGALTVLCIRHPAKGVLIGATLHIRQDEALSLRLACDLARPRKGPSPHIVSAMLGQPQHCEASETDVSLL